MNVNRQTETWIKMMEIGNRYGCHQRADRSFYVHGYQFPVCARCTGIIVGRLIGIFIPVTVKQSVFPYCVMLIPLLCDGIIQMIGIKESNNPRRLITGVLFGISELCIIKFIVKSILEVLL